MIQTTEDELTVEITRRIQASPEAVFAAWLSPRWADWLPPRDVTCAVIEMDPRLGGHYHLSMTMPDQRAVEIRGEYREITAFERLVFTWRRQNDPVETVVAITFRPDSGGTVVTLRHSGFADPALCARHSHGWGGEGGSLEKLARLLATGN